MVQGQDGIISFCFALFFLFTWCFIWAVCLLGWRTAQNRYSGKSIPSRLDSLPPASVPGVSIIRPLCGLDTNMYNTLESVMKLDYPKFEVLFAVQDENDEALPVVRMVMEKYPGIPSRIIINTESIGVNPKVNNLMAPFKEAQYDLTWVIDVTIAVTPGTLGRAVEAFLDTPFGTVNDLESTLISGSIRPPQRGDVGLVHQVPYAVVYQKTWGSLIEQAYLNTTHAKMYLAINTTKIESCVVGKANLYSRANVNSLTTPSPTLRQSPDPPKGLAGFAPFLAEDNMIALSIWHELGLTHAMTSDVALDFLGSLSIKAYIARRIRWIRVRKTMTLPATLVEPFTESIVSGIYGAWAIERLLGARIWAIWIVHMLLWLTVDLSVRRSLATNVKSVGPVGNTPVFIIAWLAREILALPIWVCAMLGSHVVWRGQKYRMLPSGEAVKFGGK